MNALHIKLAQSRLGFNYYLSKIAATDNQFDKTAGVGCIAAYPSPLSCLRRRALLYYNNEIVDRLRLTWALLLDRADSTFFDCSFLSSPPSSPCHVHPDPSNFKTRTQYGGHALRAPAQPSHNVAVFTRNFNAFLPFQCTSSISITAMRPKVLSVQHISPRTAQDHINWCPVPYSHSHDHPYDPSHNTKISTHINMPTNLLFISVALTVGAPTRN